MEETSYLTDESILTVSGGIATTIGNYLFGLYAPSSGLHSLFRHARASVSPRRPNNFTTGIYNTRPGNHSVPPFGETTIPQVSQLTAEHLKSWAINHRSPRRRSPPRNNPRPAAPNRRKNRLWKPKPLPPRSGNQLFLTVSPGLKIGGQISYPTAARSMAGHQFICRLQSSCGRVKSGNRAESFFASSAWSACKLNISPPSRLLPKKESITGSARRNSAACLKRRACCRPPSRRALRHERYALRLSTLAPSECQAAGAATRKRIGVNGGTI